MNVENSPNIEGIENFKSEVLSKDFLLYQRLKREGVLGEKKDDDEKNKADEKVKDILSTSFFDEAVESSVVAYESVNQMIAISKDEGKSDRVRQNAKNALYEVGLALSLDREVFKAATEGTDALEKILPPGLRGIHEYVLSSYLTEGKSDTEGQKLVEELIRVFELKNQDDRYPGYYRRSFNKASKDLFDKLLNLHDHATLADVESNRVGKWDTMMGYLKGIDDRALKKSELPKRKEPKTDTVLDEGGNRGKRDNLIETETNVEKLTEIARENLDRIERLEDLSNRYRYPGQPTDILDRISDRLDSELIPKAEKTGNDKDLEKYNLLKREIKARLTIFDIGKLMEDANFRIAELGRGGMADVIEQAAKMKRVLDKEVMDWCLKESKGVGYDIATAWNLIQDANFNYGDLLKKVWASLSEKEKKNFSEKEFIEVKKSLVDGYNNGLFMDRSDNPQRAELVDKYIISQLGKNGKKTYQLANELVDATAERSSFNFGFIKGDSFSEAIYFRDFRIDDAKKGKKVGPIASRDIESLAHGWLRYLPKEPEDYLTKTMGVLYAEDIKTDEIKGKKDSIMYFGKILPSYVLTTRNALMDTDPDLKKILNLSWLQELASAIDKIDIPYGLIKTPDGYREAKEEDDKKKKIEISRSGRQDIKVYYTLGLFELFATRENLGFTNSVMKDFKRIFVDTYLSDSKKPFLSESQWQWCLEQEIAHKKDRFGRVKNLTFGDAMNVRNASKIREEFWEGFFSAIGNKKKK